MRKKINFGKIDYNRTGRKINLVEVEIALEEKKQGMPVFTASAMVWNSEHTDCVMGGQCLDELLKYKELKNNKQYQKIVELWEKHHLNDMHAGTIEQEEAIDNWKKQGNKYDYNEVCEFLKSVGLYEVEYEGNPYKYGHGWIYRAIPQNDLEEIKALFI